MKLTNKMLNSLVLCALCLVPCALSAQLVEQGTSAIIKTGAAVGTSVPVVGEGAAKVVTGAANAALNASKNAASTVGSATQHINTIPTSTPHQPGTPKTYVPPTTTIETVDLHQALSQAVLTKLSAQLSPDLFSLPATYTKFARVQAVQAQGGEPIVTVLADGRKETSNVANAGDWIVTNPGGEQYIVPGNKFAKKYEPATELGEGWFKPAGGPQKFVQIKQDMDVMASWGELQHLQKGAYLNITNPNDIYGVGEAEFHATYAMEALDSQGIAHLLFRDKVSHALFGPTNTYAKFARVQAVQAQGGEPIVTVLADGTRETSNVANAGDWIVTNPGGEQYIVPGDKFAKKYEPATELGEGWFKPAGGPQLFVQINQNMDVMASWGELQHLKKGSYLNVTNPTDIYGVGEEEFHSTYKLVNP